jgi:hypothetical protein
MSGPINRQYGVPNWDDIFGKKEEKSEPTTPDPKDPNANKIDDPPKEDARTEVEAK